MAVRAVQRPAAPTIYQRKVVRHLNATNPKGWTTIGGFQVSPARGLKRNGLVTLRKLRGSWQVRLTPAGVAFAEAGAGL